MEQVSNISSQGLYWVKQELGNSLNRVREFVEAYLETPANSLPLQRALVELHQIRGTLRMVQCDGAALLAEEMKACVQDLLREADSAPEKAFEALLGSTLQLADYLQLVVAGESDNALIFLPIINELRVSRGAGVVSECELFVRYAGMQAGQPREPDVSQRPVNGAQAVAQQRLPAFQAALLRVLKDQDAAKYLRRLSQITGELAGAVSNPRGQRLFAAVGAMLSAMQDGELGADLEVKRLLGRVGQQIKHTADNGDAVLADVPDVLLYAIVYFAARGPASNPQIASLRADYRLDDLLPERDQLQALRARLRSPSPGLVNKLAAEIKDDITRVKDSIDLVIRAGDKAGIELEDTAAITAGIADTLGMLGLDMLKRVVDNQSQAIGALAQSGERDPQAWMDVALALLRVEQTLESALFAHMHNGFQSADGPITEPGEDISTGTTAIYREALINIARVKTLVPEFIDQGEPGLLREAARLLGEVEAGLGVVKCNDAMQLVARLRSFVASQAMVRARSDSDTVLLLADGIASIEYYLEAMFDGYAQPAALLERAQGYINALEMPSAQEQLPPEEVEVAETPAPAPAATPPSDGIDPEIRATFLEEAGEVLAGLQRDVAIWRNNVDDTECRADIRRAFHTLKGSGRMVGATDIGEFAWSVEYLLNRCIEQAVPTSSDVVTVVARAVAILPTLIDDFGAGHGSEQVSEVIVPADKLSGRVSESAPSAEARAQDASELLRIFRADARKHIQAIKAYSEQYPPCKVTPELVRALHSLKGSALTVQMQSVSNLARGLEQFADASRAAQLPLDETAMRFLARGASLFYARLEALDGAAEERADADIDQLSAGVSELNAQLPQAAVDDSSDRELVIVFTDEAWDLLGEIDTGLTDWQATPADGHHPTAIKAVCHKLKGSARTSEAGAIARVVEALEAQMAGYLQRAQSPGAAEFANLHNVVEALYDLLDGFRHGEREQDPRPLLAMLGVAPAAAEAEPGQTPDQPDTGSPSAPAADEPQTPDQTEFDPELSGVFFAEAGELVEQVDAQIEAWIERPEDEQPRWALLRALHTLKGSARMAGASAIGDLSHELETLIEGARTPARRSEVGLLDALSKQADELHRLVQEAGLGADAAAPETRETPEPASSTQFDARLYWHDQSREAQDSVAEQDTARVAVESLDAMLNQAGEISIYRARLEQKTSGLQFQLREFAQTTSRLREQLRRLDMETEAQIMARHESATNRYDEEFDPLEMDRYSTLHELSRGLAESVTDLGSLHRSMSELVEEDEALLSQQARVNTTLQQGLMSTLMVPFSNQQPRLQRLLRQISGEFGRQARIEFSGVDAELDRNVLERMATPMEHLLRNAVIHGLETPAERSAAHKHEVGLVSVALHREGTQLVIELGDDGRGLDYAAIRDTAIGRGLLRESARVQEADLAPFIFLPGFSTAAELTQAAGRGIGLDVVNAQIKQLGGSMAVDSQTGKGTRFTIRLPLTLAITQALMVQVGEQTYAVPIGSIEGVSRAERAAVAGHLHSDEASFNYGGLHYHMLSLGEALGGEAFAAEQDEDGPRNLPVLLARSGERRSAFIVDRMLGSREIVVKPVGPQVSTVPGVSGATIRADGEVVLILDVAALMQVQVRQAVGQAAPAAPAEITDDRPLIMVVDDSITIRRVSERFLGRNGMRVVSAKDGMDALAKLQSQPPDVVLLDIEMPRIDGFELATYMRNSDSLKNTPIIMITSRSGDKHRRRAEQIGVDRFLTKPYQEQELLQQIYAVMRARAAPTH